MNILRSRIGAPQRLAGLTLVTLAAACAGRSAPTDRMLKPTLGAAQAVDTTTGLALLPIVSGRAGGAAAWFVVTKSSDSADAARRRVNWAPRLSALRGTVFAQRGTFINGRLDVPADVDFAPTRVVRPAPNSAFPPVEAPPGSIAREGYSPLVELADGTVLNAPAIASASGALDRIVRIDRQLLFAVMRVTRGDALGRTVWYLSTEATDPMVAAMEGATWAPALAPLAQAGSPGDGVRIGLVAIVNGPTVAEDSLQRHGLRSALRGEGDPGNILEEMPGTREYTPLWDLHMAVWSPLRCATANANAC